MAETHGTRPGSPGTMGTTSASRADDRSQRTEGTDQHENWLLGRVRESAASGIESQKQRATDGLGTIAQAVRTTTEQLRTQHHESLAEYVQQAADQIDRVARQLKNKDVGELVEDAQRLARRNPAAFAGTAFAVGLVTARFLKSSADEVENGRDMYRSRPSSSRERAGLPSSSAFERGAATESSHYTPPHGDATAGGRAVTGETGSRPTTARTPTSEPSAEQKSTRPVQGRRETERS